MREDYAAGAEVRMGQHRFVCTSALGRGSYGEVWRAKVLDGEDLKEVALKDVLCQSNGELQQAWETPETPWVAVLGCSEAVLGWGKGISGGGDLRSASAPGLGTCGRTTPGGA